MSNTWRNPVNAQHKRVCLFYNILPKLEAWQAGSEEAQLEEPMETAKLGQIYERKIPCDDWTETLHASLIKRIKRAKGRWAKFDNNVSHGYWDYLTNVRDLPGFERVPAANLAGVLEKALKGIEPPLPREGPERFRPYDGSDDWVKGADKTDEEDKHNGEMIGVSREPVKWSEIEAESIVEGLPCKPVARYWRSQEGTGLVIDFRKYPKAERPVEVVKFITALGYWPTKKALAKVPAV